MRKHDPVCYQFVAETAMQVDCFCELARIAARQRASLTFTCRLCGQQQIIDPAIHYRLWHADREQGPEDWV